MTTTTLKKTIKITMSDRAPLQIVAEDWPVVASADWFSGQHECQANEEAFVRVREHADGRRIVSSNIDRGPGGMPVGYRGKAAGYLVEAPPRDANGAYIRMTSDGVEQISRYQDATIRAIRRAAGVIDMPELGDECIADLPAEEIE